MISPAGLAPRAPEARACSRCLQPRLLLARVGKLDLCLGCWRRAGEPFVYPKMTAEETLDAENAIRKGMTARGSTGRHMVRNGKT